MAVGGCRRNGGEALPVLDVQSGSRVHQRLDHWQMAVRRRADERGLSFVLAGIDGGAGRQQGLCGFQATVPEKGDGPLFRFAFPVHALPVPTADFQISFAIFSCEAFLSSKARTETIPAKSVHVHRFYALWFNRKFGRRGHFWGDRFKNPEFMGLEAVQDRILYVELNEVRAGMVKPPEQWKWGTARWRLTGNDQDLIPLDELFPADPGTGVDSGYRTRLYYRGAVPNRDNQAAIPRWILHQEQRRGYTRAGAFGWGLRFLKDGLAVGPAEKVAQATGELNVVLRELTQTVQMQSACDGFCSAPAGSEAVSLSDCSGARWRQPTRFSESGWKANRE